MTKVAILPIPTASGDVAYHALAGGKQSHGKTAGQALDALAAQLADDETGTLVIVQNFRADRFFNARQQGRLAELMERWRAARDSRTTLPSSEQAELDLLVEEEIHASTERTAEWLDELAR